MCVIPIYPSLKLGGIISRLEWHAAGRRDLSSPPQSCISPCPPAWSEGGAWSRRQGRRFQSSQLHRGLRNINVQR
jgi:hypothetical protein